jgi:CSLREA domain-containing protein
MRRSAILVVSAVVALTVAAPASAATFVVTKTADTNDGVCNADCSLREAIIRANAHGGADVIRFAVNGVFGVHGNGDDTAATGDLDVNDPLEIIGNGASNTIVDAHGNDRVFQTNDDTTIRRLTVRGGGNVSAPDNLGAGILNLANLRVFDSVVANNGPVDAGGGIANSGDIADFQRNTVDANSATESGGGIFNDGDVFGVFTHNVFRHNSATDGGGAIMNNDDFFPSSFSSNQFVENSSRAGGAIYNAADFGPHLASGNLWRGNSADMGGAFFNGDDFGFGMTFRHNVFVGNSALFQGGAFQNQDAFGLGGLTFTDNLFDHNTALAGPGGGFFNNGNFGASPGTIFSRNVLRGNSAAFGGGFFNDSVILNDVVITDNLFSGNTAAFGGGFYNNSVFADAIFRGNTFDHNSASSEGGGFLNGSNVCAVGEGPCGANNVDFSGNTFSFNQAGNAGGGLSNFGAFFPPIVNSTFSQNRALHGDGGGVWTGNSSVDLEFEHVTFAGNSAGDDGEGLFVLVGGEVNMFAVIMANGHPGDECAGSGDFESTGYSMDLDDTCNLLNPTDQPSTNPLLGPLGSFGGPTQTHLLRRSSHAIDRVTAGCPPPAIDQRGVSRPQNGAGPHGHHCDIGAVEMRPGEAAP